MAAAKQI